MIKTTSYDPSFLVIFPLQGANNILNKYSITYSMSFVQVAREGTFTQWHIGVHRQSGG